MQDKGHITLEAKLTGEKGQFDCPIKLSFFGPSDARARIQLEHALKTDKLLKATELKQTKAEAETRRKILGLKSGKASYGLGGQGEEEQPSLNDILQGSEAVDLRSSGDGLKSLAMTEEMLSKLPMAKQPESLKAQLLPYQLQVCIAFLYISLSKVSDVSQGLHWLTTKESPTLPEAGSQTPTQLWKKDNRGRFVNLASHFVTSTAPQLLLGGVLADDMGLGKTVQIISLMLASPGQTLIVAPVTVMSNWEQQIKRHVLPEKLPSVVIYHGNKKLTSKQLKEYDVVVTSYGKLTSENKGKASKLLLGNKWRRVVLDEGHTIRNARTETALAACQVQAESRWVLSGTPM